jgi:hypothetical protein
VAIAIVLARLGVLPPRPGFKISAKFRPNFTKFGNFGGGRKKTPKFCNILIHVMYNSKIVFFYWLYCIFFLFNRCVVINHTNIYLDLNFFRNNVLHILISKKIRQNFGRISRNSVISVVTEIFAITKIKSLAAPAMNSGENI